jgi:hypothetical protein
MKKNKALKERELKHWPLQALHFQVIEESFTTTITYGKGNNEIQA